MKNEHTPIILFAVILFLGWLSFHNANEAERYRNLYNGQKEFIEDFRKRSVHVQDSLIRSAENFRVKAQQYDSLETKLRALYEKIPGNVARIPRSELDAVWAELGY